LKRAASGRLMVTIFSKLSSLMIASLASHRTNDMIAANFRAALISERLYGEAAPESAHDLTAE
jgi:hypothetical protein